MCSVGQFLCAYLELLQSQNAVAFTTALSQTAYLSKEFCSFNLCRMMTSIPTTVVVECVPTELVGTHQVCFKTSSYKLCCGRFSHKASCVRYSCKACCGNISHNKSSGKTSTTRLVGLAYNMKSCG